MIPRMRVVILLLVVYIAVNIGSRCRLSEAAVPPPGCTQLGGTGLVYCPSGRDPQ
jgi:hypothetical protein